MNTIKFILNPNNENRDNIFEFINYQGFSDLIEQTMQFEHSKETFVKRVLEITVSDKSLSISDFEYGYLEYIKFMVLKNMISDILNKKKFWKLEDFKSCCKDFNFNCKLFNFLGINLTNQEIMLVDKLNNNYYPIDIMDLCENLKKHEDFFDYYFTDYNDSETEFDCYSGIVEASINSNYEIFKWFFEFIEFDDNNVGFKYGIFIGLLYGNLDFTKKLIADFNTNFIKNSLDFVGELSNKSHIIKMKHWNYNNIITTYIICSDLVSDIFDQCAKQNDYLKLEFLHTFFGFSPQKQLLVTNPSTNN